MTVPAWLALGLIVALLAWVWKEWRSQQRSAVPDAVRSVRARHAAPEPDETPAPVDEPAVPEPDDDVPAPAKHSRDIFDRVGADANWAKELAAVSQGELTPAGMPTASIDEFDDWTIWEAEFQADLRRCDNALEDARRLCAVNMAAAGAAPMWLMQELDRRDLVAHERALDHATVLTTSEFPAVPGRRRLTVAQARRARKREHRGDAA